MQAEDRLFQIELVRRNARGSRAELFGSIDSSTIDEDKQSLNLFSTDAELRSQYEALPRWVRDAVDNFVAGLNAYVEHANATPGTSRCGARRPDTERPDAHVHSPV